VGAVCFRKYKVTREKLERFKQRKDYGDYESDIESESEDMDVSKFSAHTSTNHNFAPTPSLLSSTGRIQKMPSPVRLLLIFQQCVKIFA